MAEGNDDFATWILSQGGDADIIAILSRSGFNSKLALRYLDLTSDDGRQLRDELNYGQMCFISGLVDQLQPESSASTRNPYSNVIKRATGMTGKKGAIRECLEKLFNFGGNTASKQATESGDQAENTSKPSHPTTSFSRKKRKGKGKAGPMPGKNKGDETEGCMPAM